jgi:RNA polymerase sigma factor (sigma-70 family)
MAPSKQEVEDRIVSVMREYFLKYTDEVAEKYKDQIQSLVKWYIRTLPRHIASSEADDLTSEAKIAFIDALKTWDPRRGELWSYVSVRLKGSMQDYLRKRGTDPVAGLYEWITSAANVYLAFNKESVHHEKVDEILHIDSAVRKLGDKEQVVVKKYYREDKTFKEIGKEIGLSESQVSRICKEATAKIKKSLVMRPSGEEGEEAEEEGTVN